MAIQDYFNQVQGWQSKSAIDKFGNYSFGTAATIYGRIQLKKTILRSDNQQMIIADAIDYVPASHNIRTNDRITYTDSTSVVRNFEVIEVYEARNKSGIHHKKLLLKYAKV